MQSITSTQAAPLQVIGRQVQEHSAHNNCRGVHAARRDAEAGGGGAVNVTVQRGILQWARQGILQRAGAVRLHQQRWGGSDLRGKEPQA